MNTAVTIWIAYYLDWSDFALFETEVEALRHAVDRAMRVKPITLPVVDIRKMED